MNCYGRIIGDRIIFVGKRTIPVVVRSFPYGICFPVPEREMAQFVHSAILVVFLLEIERDVCAFIGWCLFD